MVIPWGSLEESMMRCKLQVLLGTWTLLGISQSELIPAVQVNTLLLWITERFWDTGKGFLEELKAVAIKTTDIVNTL